MSSVAAAEQQRFTAEMKVDASLLSALIGKSGANVSRIRNAVRCGCFIRGDNDTFTISAFTPEAVKLAAKMLRQDEKKMKQQAEVDPVTRSVSRPVRPSTVISDIPVSLIPIIIGKQGVGLKAIQTEMGQGGYIVVRDNAFHLSADSDESLESGIAMLRQRVEQLTHPSSLAADSHGEKKLHRQTAEKQVVVRETNRFAVFGSEQTKEEVVQKKKDDDFPALTTNNDNKKQNAKAVSSVWSSGKKMEEICSTLSVSTTPWRESETLKTIRQEERRLREEEAKKLREKERTQYQVTLDFDEDEFKKIAKAQLPLNAAKKSPIQVDLSSMDTDSWDNWMY